MDNAAFMDEFFSQVTVTVTASKGTRCCCFSDLHVLCNFLYLTFAFQIEDIRSSIDKIDDNVAEVKKLFSVILSAPTSDQSKIPLHHQPDIY